MRAEEFRAKSSNAQHRQTKEALLKAAENYEQLARAAEQVRTVDELEGRALIRLTATESLVDRAA
jgi:hypothetical protein